MLSALDLLVHSDNAGSPKYDEKKKHDILKRFSWSRNHVNDDDQKKKKKRRLEISQIVENDVKRDQLFTGYVTAT